MDPKLNNGKVLYPELSYKIYGLCFETQNKLGRYLSEKQYGDFLENLFKGNNINYVREKPLPVSFVGEKEGRNIPDFIIEDSIILDLKAKFIITKQDYYQMQRYLNSYNKKLGLILNFRKHYLTPRRVLNSKYENVEEEEAKFSFNNSINKLKKYIRHS
ncbi:MAG: hypothetical protein A2Y82_05445 [Candidatus Buchananbacteria bacterium RBG_13_36_9]|uniref:GxxExxY protein n=1 Tax=Candidatus Buchananbacteria bacterium RBG_13_36_9 TaxID=1797530 RepID=A0A1G1XPH9_9BACT|nr:MAG: hypothetical protein A2Y82_05445 [Candidatus Buchananbacteria bacterium RBG_13_36_9]